MVLSMGHTRYYYYVSFPEHVNNCHDFKLFTLLYMVRDPNLLMKIKVLSECIHIYPVRNGFIRSLGLCVFDLCLFV